jgi:hypothetical protein
MLKKKKSYTNELQEVRWSQLHLAGWPKSPLNQLGHLELLRL